MVFDNEDVGNSVINNDFIGKYIPGFNFDSAGQVDSVINFLDQDLSFDFGKYPEVSIGLGGMSEKDIISLIELVLERARQEKGVYCIHSATVIYKDKAVIFWGGASGMGKTRMARKFAEDGALFYSDEKTLIDFNSTRVVGGIPYQYLEKDYWIKKLGVTEDDSYHRSESASTGSFPIMVFVYGFAIDGAVFSADKWSPEKFEWHIYEELGRKIRAISRRVKDASVSVPSIDSQECADKRISLIKRNNSLPCYSVQGTPEAIIEFIKTL